MSRLNASIKLVAMVGECFFVIFSFVLLAIASLVLSGKLIAFDVPAVKKMAYMVVALSLTLIFCTGYGCYGARHQTRRKGCCTGRRVLSLHQLLLIAILAISSKESNKLGKRARSIALVIANITDFPRYDNFENDTSQYFNIAYFGGICAADSSSDALILDWVEWKCPSTMSRKICALDVERKRDCDTACLVHPWNSTYCCPDEDLCRSGHREACPYDQCRSAVLKELHSRMRPTATLLNFIAFLSGIMIVLTCLLICYNPRDEVEIELLKSGMITEQEVKMIRKLKSQSKQLSFGDDGGAAESGKRTTFSFDKIRDNDDDDDNTRIDAERRKSLKPKKRIGRHSRVYPSSPNKSGQNV